MVRKVGCADVIGANEQANKAQQDKLAALKEWAHIDAFDGAAIRSVKDNLLYNILRDAYKTDEAKAQKEGADGEPPAKKLRGNDSTDSTGSSRSTSVSVDRPESDEDSDEEPIRPSAHLRRTKRPRPSRTSGVDMGIVKKHNLHTIADEGGVGRVLFVFEKESKSRL